MFFFKVFSVIFPSIFERVKIINSQTSELVREHHPFNFMSVGIANIFKVFVGFAIREYMDFAIGKLVNYGKSAAGVS